MEVSWAVSRADQKAVSRAHGGGTLQGTGLGAGEASHSKAGTSALQRPLIARCAHSSPQLPDPRQSLKGNSREQVTRRAWVEDWVGPTHTHRP